MPQYSSHDFDSDADQTPIRPGQLSANGHWIFGSVFAGLTLIGFSFGVWAGAAKTKPVEVVEAKKEVPEKPAPKPIVTPPVVTPPAAPPVVPVVEPKPKEPEPKEPDPKPKEPEPKPKEPDPKPKPKEPDPKPKEPEAKKPPAKAVAFKEVAPLFRSYCGNCHGLAGKPKGGVDLRSIAAIMKGGDDGALVKAGDPDKSPLYDSIKAGRMPPDGKPGPTEKELMLIRDWIAGGAKERRRTVRRRDDRRRGRRGRRRMELTPQDGVGKFRE